ncbi:hypothetical protein NDU88_009969 [Pleurodeles waltl]|uniref:Uncharacterized protein n=1 Tax=Pleurodeles waltl TaxID=8319 RepID=A0AAV7QV14_PLEWA|nr:hypothetical protein NDU88_009969 [Pleurodeles waltl]
MPPSSPPYPITEFDGWRGEQKLPGISPRRIRQCHPCTCGSAARLAQHQDRFSSGDHFLKDISAVGRRLEGMDNAMASMTAETKSIRLDIAGFQSCMMGLEQRMTMVEAHVGSSRERDQELQYFCSKMTDLEDRSQRDYVQFLGFPENIWGEDIQSLLWEKLPKLTGITFDPPLQFQRAHRLGPKRSDVATRPQLIIACLLRHT